MKNLKKYCCSFNKVLLVLLLILTNTGLLLGQTSIKSAEISFVFVSKDVDGTIEGFKSGSAVDLEEMTNSRFKGSVAVETIKTGNFLRDWSLKGGKYFDADDYPRISFESMEILVQDNGFIAKGKLTIKETSKNISIEFVRKGNQLYGSTSLYSSDFGIQIKSKREDNLVEVKINLDLQL